MRKRRRTGSIDPGHSLEQHLGVGFGRSPEQRRDGVGLDNPAVPHHDNSVGHLGNHAHVVRDQEQARSGLPRDSAHQVEDLGLDRHVERGRRFIRDQQTWLERHYGRDHHPLAHTPGELVRILAQPCGGITDSDALEHFDRPFLGGSAIQLTVYFERLGHLPTDRQNGVQGRHRFLEDHADAVAPKASPRLLIKAEDIVLLKRYGTVRDAGRLRKQAHDRQGRHALAGPALADQGHGLAHADIERNLGHDGSRVAMVKGNRQRGYFQQWSDHRPLPWGSTASRMASPRRLNASTTSAIARPG